jgi:hypothetical protein
MTKAIPAAIMPMNTQAIPTTTFHASRRLERLLKYGSLGLKYRNSKYSQSSAQTEGSEDSNRITNHL